MANHQPAELPITAALLDELRGNYHAVVDDFLPRTLADSLLRDAERLHSEGHFRQHYFQFGGEVLQKPHVFELDLSDPDKLDDYDNLGVWGDIVSNVGPSFVRQVDELDKANPEESSSLSLDSNAPPMVKLQLNSGGGSFPWHYDNPGPPNQRALTCVVYLNPNWKEGDGGEICLSPFLSKKSIVVPPLHMRAVLFYSDRIVHRVLPSKVRRVCFTMWCNGTKVNEKKDVVLSRDVLQFASYDDAQRFFERSPLQRVISRAVYSEEYLDSLLECVLGKNGRDGDDSDSEMEKERKVRLVKQHDASVLGILSKLRPLIEEFRRRKRK